MCPLSANPYTGKQAFRTGEVITVLICVYVITVLICVYATYNFLDVYLRKKCAMCEVRL